jgi:hypothetical protein
MNGKFHLAKLTLA